MGEDYSFHKYEPPQRADEVKVESSEKVEKRKRSKADLMKMMKQKSQKLIVEAKQPKLAKVANEVKTLQKSATFLGTLHAGDAFGEIALQTSAGRACTALAASDTILLTCQKRNYEKVLREVQLQEREEMRSFLSTVPLFDHLAREDLLSLADIVR